MDTNVVDFNEIWERRRQRARRGELPELEYFNRVQPALDVTDFVAGTLTEGGATVVYGESNSGKTFFVLDLALHVASGLPWNGRRIEQGGVLYCCLEGGQAFRNRIAAWKEQHDALETPVHFAFMCGSLDLRSIDGHTEQLILAIAEAAKKMGVPVKLVVIDTLARAMAGGNENGPEDMGALVANIDRLRLETGANILFVHHSGKDQARGARGHSSLQAAIDTEIEIEAPADDGDGIRTARVVKQRELTKGDEHRFRLEPIEIGSNRHGEPVTTCLVRYIDQPRRAGRRKLKGQQARALEVLTNLIAQSGQDGFLGCPDGHPSVPADWWRERFYSSAMPGEEPATKQKAFRRASDGLVEARLVGMSTNRVWLVYPDSDEAQDAA